MAGVVEDFTIGVEEEFQILDPQTRALRSRVGRILPVARAEVGKDVTNELYLSQIEIGTPVCRTLAEVRAELGRLRRGVIDAAEKAGARIAAAGTHPFSHWMDQPITPKPRYLDLEADYQQLIREQVIFGCHVHVGIADRDVAIRVMNRVRPWLAPIVALSASSPFWLGEATGYASFRTQINSRFPTAGIPHEFASRAEFDQVVADLVSVGMIQDGSNIYWDIRPSSHVETVEFRIADVCTTIDEAVMVAAICRGLVRTCHAEEKRGEGCVAVRPELLKAASWHAARFGLEGNLVDVRSRTPAPAADVVRGLLGYIRPALLDAGEWEEVETLVERTLATGNSAQRQRAAHANSRRLEDVVDLVIQETSAGV